MTLQKTDNANLPKKLAIRMFALEQLEKNESDIIRILDCYAGDGLLWYHLKKNSRYCIEQIGIDALPKAGALYLGDNRRYLKQLPIHNYDLIDIDAYGVPYEQMKILARRKYGGIIVGTFIQSVYGGLSYTMLEDIGYTRSMVRKITKLFFQNGWDKWLTFLNTLGYNNVFVFHCKRKHYFCCLPRKKALQ